MSHNNGMRRLRSNRDAYILFGADAGDPVVSRQFLPIHKILWWLTFSLGLIQSAISMGKR